MKKLSLFVVPLMSITLLSSCNGSNTPQVVEHIVTFESNGGTHINTQKVKDKETATEPNPSPTKTDYTFGGWFINPDFAGGGYDFNTPVTEDITLYADWNGGPAPVIPTYTIDFQGENCTSTLDTSKQYHAGDEVSFELVIEDKTQYKFPESINVSGVSKFEYSSQTGAVSFTVESKDIGVVAIAGTIDPTVQHTVTFVLNGATSSPINPVKVDDGSLFPGDKIPTNPTNPGHSFDGWSKNEKSKDIVDLTKATINSDLILYAWWSNPEIINITFDALGGYFDGDPTIKKKVVPTPYGQVPVAPMAPSKISDDATHTFTGWDSQLEPASYNKTTYYANYHSETNEYVVTFDPNGGTIVSGETSLVIRHGYTLKDEYFPEVFRYGYKKYDTDAWYDDPVGGNPVVNRQVSRNMTVYVHWHSPTMYNVIFNANGGIYAENNSEEVKRENIIVDNMPDIPSNPTRIDLNGVKTYKFVGYDKEVVPVRGEETTITYTAQWEETTNHYSVTVDANGGHFIDGESVKTFSITAGTKVSALSSMLNPIYDLPNDVKILDKFVYSDDELIGEDDIVNKEGISIKATYRKKTLEECSWAEINFISQQGADFAESYFGPIIEKDDQGNIVKRNLIEKSIVINNSVHKVRIIGYGQDYSNLNRKDKTVLGITFEFSNLISDSEGYSLAAYWNDVSTQEGSNYNYKDSTMRAVLNGHNELDSSSKPIRWFQYFGAEEEGRSDDQPTDHEKNKHYSEEFAGKSVIDMLPNDLKSVLKTTSKYINLHNGGSTGSWAESTVEDKLFLLSPRELGKNFSGEEQSTTTYSYYLGDLDMDQRQVLLTKPQVAIDHNGQARTDFHQAEGIDGEYNSGHKRHNNSAGVNYYDIYNKTNGGDYALRSPDLDTELTQYDDRYVYYITSGGSTSHNNACDWAVPVAPAFCI